MPSDACQEPGAAAMKRRMTIDALLGKWLNKKGAGERAEYQLFLTKFAQVQDRAAE